METLSVVFLLFSLVASLNGRIDLAVYNMASVGVVRVFILEKKLDSYTLIKRINTGTEPTEEKE